MEKTINIKVNSDLYRDIKINIAKKDLTLKDYIIHLIESDLNNSRRLEKDK